MLILPSTVNLSTGAKGYLVVLLVLRFMWLMISKLSGQDLGDDVFWSKLIALYQLFWAISSNKVYGTSQNVRIPRENLNCKTIVYEHFKGYFRSMYPSNQRLFGCVEGLVKGMSSSLELMVATDKMLFLNYWYNNDLLQNSLIHYFGLIHVVAIHA